MFLHDFACKLTLTIEGTAVEIPCGQLKNFAVELHNYGFEASLDFWLAASDDTLFPLFVKQSLIDVSFLVDAHYNPPDNPPEPILLQGLVTQKSLQELNIPIQDIPVLFRHYFIQFADPAQVLWKQHFPCELFVDKTMENVISTYQGEKIAITYNWPLLETQYPILFIGLNFAENQASFYDFLIWYVQTNNGIFSYDSQMNTYSLLETKSDKGTAQSLIKLAVADWQILFPETVRHNGSVINAYAETPTKQEVQNSQAVTGIRKDILVRMPVAEDFSAQATLEGKKLKLREHEVVVHLQDFPTVTMKPDYLIELSGVEWGEKNFTNGKSYRMVHTSVKGVAQQQDPAENQQLQFAGYNTEISLHLELQAETYVTLPPFRSPHYPVYVEGKVLSEAGQETEETYQIYQEEQHSTDVYKVTVPLWSDQKVIVAFNPNLFPGHFYFPAFKKARVLLALEFQTARIERFLDWRPGARLPAESQGNHILFGLTEQSKTSLNHIYQDQKPILNIKRTSDKDTGSLQIKEGAMILEIKEEA